MTRKLATDEQALWARVAATVKPLRPRPARPEPPVKRAAPGPGISAASRPKPLPAAEMRQQPHGAHGLDASWDRRLAGGLVRPDMVVDLHGHSLAEAHALLAARLDEAVSTGARVILLITGKPPQGGNWPAGRGAIRAAVGDWLAASSYAGRIAAVRGAHPRHGGAGALYLILRRHPARHRQKS